MTRVLVVDDEPHVAHALRRLLCRQHDVEVALSGAAARDLLAGGARFDVIVCDLMMPELSGMDLYDWIGERRPELAPAFVFVTGGAFTSRAQAFLDRVPNERLDKPFEPRRVRAVIDAAVRRVVGARQA